MPIYKCSLGFGVNGFGSIPADGLTDQWYANTSDLEALKVKCRTYMDRRVAICNNLLRGVRFRISDVQAGTLTFQQRYRPGPGPFPTPDTPWNALWTTVDVANLGTRREWLIRGMTDEFIVQGDWVPGAGWAGNFNALITTIRAAPQFGLRIISRTNPLRVVSSVIAGLATVSSNAGIGPGDIVRFFRTRYTDKNLGSVTGDWIVQNVSGTTGVQLLGWPDGAIVDHGKLRKIQYDVAEVVDIQVAGVRSRKVGRPLELLAGRSKKRP